MLNIEINDLHRLIEFLQRKLIYISQIVSNNLPDYIWREILKHHFISFRNFHRKLYYTHKNKFNWLIKKKEDNYTKNIKPIKLSYPTKDKNTSQPLISTNNEQFTDLIKTENSDIIFPNHFQKNPFDPLNHTNNKWFINLTDMTIPTYVSNLLQLGNKFSLPIVNNKKLAIHEFIKDLEGNSKRSNIKNLTTIRNIIVPQFSRFL